MKHTKGKWEIQTEFEGDQFIINAPRFFNVAWLPFNPESKEQARANALLIANAPTTKENHDKMYEALKELVLLENQFQLHEIRLKAKDLLNSIE